MHEGPGAESEGINSTPKSEYVLQASSLDEVFGALEADSN